MNWPATFGYFCLARTKLDSYHCVRTHVGLTLFNCYPIFFTEKEGAGASKTTLSVLSAIIWVAKARVMIDVSTFFERHAVGTFDVCLARPKKLSRLYRPSARGSTYD